MKDLIELIESVALRMKFLSVQWQHRIFHIFKCQKEEFLVI